MPADLLRVDLDPYDRVFAISDIHGCLRAFDSLLDCIAPTSNDLIVTLGDYVDRGLDSCGVLNRLIELHENNNINIHSLRGNHDQMMIDAKDGPEDLDFWLNLGGQSTLASYPEESYGAIPASHLDFLTRACVDLIEAETCIFVHGYVDPEDPVEMQETQTLYWARYKHSAPHASGKMVVCGHAGTPSGIPEYLGHTLATETSDWLNAVEVFTRDYWRADERGECRKGSI